jgi:predicted AlkP superfamily pyrophosphatase or phosphodiesterase
MLPSVPKTLGRLSDVFASCLGSITGVDNRLGLRSSNSVIAVLVDGLGTANLKFGAGHAPFLNRELSISTSIHAGFPSTTASSITSFATGLPVGQHGIVGYKVLDPSTNQAVNQLTGWSSKVDPLLWQPHETISERAVAQGIPTFVIGPGDYEKSGFTALTMRGAKYLPARTIHDRVATAVEVVSSNQHSLVYFYVPELDQAAHTYGVDSHEWLLQLENLDGAMAQLTKSLNSKRLEKVGLALTADHGVIDVARSNHIFLDELLLPELKLVAGDPRVNYLYLQDSTDNTVARAMESIEQQLSNSVLGRSVKLATKKQVIDAGWFGAGVSAVAAARMPDIFAVAVGKIALYHREFAPAKSLEMIGQHGSISGEEISIPLIKLAALAPSRL